MVSGIDLTTKRLSFEAERPEDGSIAEATVECVRSVNSLITFSVGQTVKLFRNFTGAAIADPTDLVFQGYLVKLENDGPKIKLICKDKMWDAVRREINRTFLDTDAEAGKISEIVKTILTTCGLSYDSTTIQDSGTTQIIKRFVCNRANCMERLKTLADALQWQLYYRPDTDKVYFEPKGFTGNSNILTVGQEIIKAPKWETDSQEMANDMYVIGGQQWVETTVFFNGTGAQNTFTLPYKPESIKVYVGGTLKKGGLDTVTTGAQYTVDKEKLEFTFTSGNTPPSGSNNVEAQITYVVPIPIHLTESVSVASYGTHQKTLTLVDAKNLDDAISRGKKVLDLRKDPPKHAVLKVRKHDVMNLQAGQTINIVDAVNGFSGVFTINRYIIHSPLDYDEVYVGEKEFKLADLQADILTKLKRMDEDQNRNTDKTTELVQAGAPLMVRRKSRRQIKRSICDSFILNHPENGKLDQGVVLNPLDATTGWTGTNATVTVNSTLSDYYIQNALSLKLAYTNANFEMSTTESNGDLSAFTGVSSGTPTQGTAGVWLFLPEYFRWTRKQGILVDNTGSASTLTNYAVRISIDNTWTDFWSNVASDGRDIRFLDSDNFTRLSYWIEAWDAVAQTATVWVKVPSIPGSSSKTINLYYGRAVEASESNGSNVFTYFEDFETYGIGSDLGGQGGWTKQFGEGSSFARIANLNGKNHFYGREDDQSGVLNLIVDRVLTVSNSGSMVEARVNKAVGFDTQGEIVLNDTSYGASGLPNNGYFMTLNVGGDTNKIRKTVAGATTDLVTEVDGPISGTYYIYGLSWLSTALKMWKNYAQRLSTTDSSFTSRSRLVLKLAGNPSEWYYDWVRVRPFTDPEPVTSKSGAASAVSVPITQVKLQIGSSSGNYKEYIGTEIRGSGIQGGRNYLLFDLDNPSASVGTANWTTVAYKKLLFTSSLSSGECWVDYLTISKSNSIGLNGLGYRYIDDATEYTFF